MGLRRFTIAVDEQLHYDFKTYAAFKGTSMSKILCSYMKELMEKEKDFTTAIQKEKTKGQK